MDAACELFPDLERSDRWNRARWDAYDRAHVWTAAYQDAMERGKCEACGSDGSTPKSALDAIGPMPRKPGERAEWAIARQRLHMQYGLRVEHRAPLTHDVGFDSCEHHATNLVVLCMACRNKH